MKDLVKLSLTLLIAASALTACSRAELSASPNPVPVCDGSGVGMTTLRWSSKSASTIEIRVGAPDGALFTRGEGTGTATTGNWVKDGTIFYLQDVSDGKGVTRGNTLATLEVAVSSESCP